MSFSQELHFKKISTNNKFISKIILFILEGIHIFSIVWLFYFYKFYHELFSKSFFIFLSFIYISILVFILQIILKKNKEFLLFWLFSLLVNFLFLFLVIQYI